MTQEEKAKRYDEAINRMKHYVVDEYGCSRIKVADIFPELKESEDERMKNAAIRACKYMIDNFENSTKDYEDAIAWLEKQKTSEEALQYLRENHSSSEMSDFQAAMNIAVAKSYDKGYNDGLEKQGEQKPAKWSEEDENHIQHISDFIMRNRVGDTDTIYRLEQDVNWLKSLKDRYTWKPSDEKILKS